MIANILTLHPEVFPGTLGIGVVGRGLKQGLWQLNTINMREYAQDKHRSVDAPPYGGGAGMVLRPDVVGKAIDAMPVNKPLFYLSPRGKPVTQQWCVQQAKQPCLNLICGRYEGLDQRVIDYYNIQEISIGDYVLSGGEVAAMAIIDAIIRLIPGVFGNDKSGDEESFSNGLLEYPHYTKPAIWQGLSVPDILKSGNHAEIAKWRLQQSIDLTQKQRPDLLNKTNLT